MGVAATAAVLLALNLSLYLILFGPAGGVRRLEDEVRGVVAARGMETGEKSAREAFAERHGVAGNSEPASIIRGGLRQDAPFAFDAATAQAALDRYGAIDAQTLPPGVYLGAGPIGPDGWPLRLLGALAFPKHGYLVLVPPPVDGRFPPAQVVTASYRKDFRNSGDGDVLYARMELYRPEAFDFPRPGEPVHDLTRLNLPIRRVVDIRRDVEATADHIQEDEQPYRLRNRNSNSALHCFLRSAGLTPAELRPLQKPIIRLRLPGVSSSRACRG